MQAAEVFFDQDVELLLIGQVLATGDRDAVCFGPFIRHVRRNEDGDEALGSR
jgi:hypothetical protein